MLQEYNHVLERAMTLAKERHPNSPAQHRAAFANSVAYLVTGASGGYGGPSMREHWASRIGHSAGLVSNSTFEQAVEAVDACCFGPLTYEHACMLDVEHCFDDAPGEVDAAQQLLAAKNREN
jgi:hypothetical protein